MLTRCASSPTAAVAARLSAPRSFAYGRAKLKEGAVAKGSPASALSGKEATKHWWVLEDKWGESIRSKGRSGVGSTLMAFKSPTEAQVWCTVRIF